MNVRETIRDMPGNCPQCGAALPVSALGELCPACLLKQGAVSDTAAQSEPTQFQPPGVGEVARLFPQLEILDFIGKGGMGAVYKARQPALDRFVALKILPPQAAGGPGFAERFNREARALARLSHPNIVAVHEFGKVEHASSLSASEASKTETGKIPIPLHFFIMEYVDGLNLRQLERAGKLSPRQALQIVPQICEALQFAHDEGIVHRDIKPENILLDKKGRVKIADFGIAKIIGREAGVAITETKGAIGTPHYMAPEQVEKPQLVDHRADIFSLGVVFYEMLTGELPLGKFAPPSRKVQVDVRLDEVVLRALEKEPELRYQQASHVKTDVETIASGIPANDPHESKTGRLNDVNRILAGLLVFALVAVIALTTAMRYRQARPPGIAVAFTGYSTSAARVRFTTIQRTPQAALPINVMLPAGSQFAQFSVTNTSKSAFTLYQPYRIETQIAGSWQELSAGMFDSNRVVAPQSSASLLIPAPTTQLPWRVAVQYIHQGTLRSRLEGGPGSWRLRCTSETIQPDRRRTAVSESAPAETAKQSPHNSGAASEGETVLHHAFTADALLDLDHGKRLSLPPDSEQWDRVRFMMWLASAGVELAVLDYGDDASGWGLATRRGLCRIDDLLWDTLEATKVQKALASGQPGLEQLDSDGNKFSIYQLLAGLPPISFALTTSEGRLAAFQITGFTDNPRGVKIRYKLVPRPTAATSFGEKPLPAASKVPPVVTQTIPESGTAGVVPGLTEIRATFSRPMSGGSWSWSTWREENFPEITDTPRYLDDQRTCVLPVRLLPGKVYALWLNSENAQNFKDREDVPAVPYLLIFETGK